MAIGIVKGFTGTKWVPPVGFVWKSASSTSPASIYAGTTWSQIEDRAIIGAGSSYANGATGGATSVTLGTSNLPSHNHSGSTSSSGSHTHTVENNYFTTSSYYGLPKYGGNYLMNQVTGYTSWAGGHSHSASVNNAGSGSAFSILNTYVVRYMWERIG